jgi:hypothetical protein
LDRICFDIDINRDYVTSWHFEIDHRGWTTESIFGDLNWNPEYFVACHQDEHSWTLEVAIPLNQLAGDATRSAWGLRMERTIPHDRSLGWDETAEVQDPESNVRSEIPFGMLIFE